MTLKLKSKIYKLTGVYLAKKEELEYIKSYDFWTSFISYFHHPENDMAPRSIQGLLIGLWQAKHGFTRRYKGKKYGRRNS